MFVFFVFQFSSKGLDGGELRSIVITLVFILNKFLTNGEGGGV